ncbi:glutathione S-transferase family protein [Marinicella sp. W31]|uniref:glutathione S-transferase family protein n=1 Tax=Marinicella sp. W31 TaxID=3023713 RepID=UPI0037570186
MITLYTAATPNGWKITTMMAELELEYELVAVNLGENEQKQPEFLKMNPNGRIPVIVDHEAGDFVVFESGAILWYLAEKYQQFIPSDVQQKSEVLQWLMFQMSGVGPMMGQANVFFRYFPEKIPSVISRFQTEVQRLFGVLDERLKDREYLVGDYSIADIAHWCWVHTHHWSGVELTPYENLSAWKERIAARKAVQKGISLPMKVSKEDVKKAGQKIIVT